MNAPILFTQTQKRDILTKNLFDASFEISYCISILDGGNYVRHNKLSLQSRLDLLYLHGDNLIHIFQAEYFAILK